MKKKQFDQSLKTLLNTPPIKTGRKPKVILGEDFKEILTKGYLTDVSESHLEAWKDRYSQYGGNKRKVEDDIYCNHDDSLEVESLEEKLGRELSSDEYDYFTAQFHKTVVEVWANGF